MAQLTPLGHARVYRHPVTGDLVVDTDSLRRTHFAGADDFGGYDDFEGYDDDFEGYDDDEDDFGLFRRDPERKKARRSRRMDRKRSRVDRKHKRRSDRLDRKGLDDEDEEPESNAAKGNASAGWGMTAVGGSETLTAAGGTSVRIRLQHDFRAKDVTFTGSSVGALVTSIFFGDRVVWSAPDGIDATVFAANGFIRGLLKGQSLKAGLDVTINGTLPDAGVFSATLTGEKPVRRNC